LPTFMRFDAIGTPLSRLEGLQDVEKLLEFSECVQKKATSKLQ